MRGLTTSLDLAAIALLVAGVLLICGLGAALITAGALIGYVSRVLAGSPVPLAPDESGADL